MTEPPPGGPGRLNKPGAPEASFLPESSLLSSLRGASADVSSISEEQSTLKSSTPSFSLLKATKNSFLSSEQPTYATLQGGSWKSVGSLSNSAGSKELNTARSGGSSKLNYDASSSSSVKENNSSSSSVQPQNPRFLLSFASKDKVGKSLTFTRLPKGSLKRDLSNYPSVNRAAAPRFSLAGGGNRLPGRFEADDVLISNALNEAAQRFVLNQNPQIGRVPSTVGTVPKSLSSISYGGRLSSKKKGTGVSRIVDEELLSDDETPQMHDVYSLEALKSGLGQNLAPDNLLLSGSRALIRSKAAPSHGSVDFSGMDTVQIIGASFLGKCLLQRIDSLKLAARAFRAGSIYPSVSPQLCHVPRKSIRAAGPELDAKAEETISAVDSLVYLPACNDAAIVDSLQQRFAQRLYFTCCDNMLIFVKPLAAHAEAFAGTFGQAKAIQYWTGNLAELQPHPYLFARRALLNAKTQHRNQLLLTFGSFACGQDRLHDELVQFFIRFSLNFETLLREEGVPAAERLRDAAVCLLEPFHITQGEDLFGSRLMDLFQVELDEKGEVIGFAFLPNSTLEPSQEVVSWQMRQSLKNAPLPTIFYNLLYSIHYKPEDPLLACTDLHPVDVTELLRFFPIPALRFEDVHYKKYCQWLSALSVIGVSEDDKKEFLRLLSAILVADVASFKRQKEIEAEMPRRPGKAETSKGRFASKKTRGKSTKEAPPANDEEAPMTLAGLDILTLLANLLEVDERALRDLFYGSDMWQTRFLGLKLFVRLRWWLLGMISESLRLSKVSQVHTRITLIKAAGLDLRRAGQEWALNQLLHNYTEECFMHLFATWAFTLDHATYELEGVEAPPLKSVLNEDVLEIFAGPNGIWRILKEEHAFYGGEAADILSDGVPLAAISIVEKILKINGRPGKILKVPGYAEAAPSAHKPQRTFKMPKVSKLSGSSKEQTPLGTPPTARVDRALCQFSIVHTSGIVIYDASKFCLSDANAYSVPPKLRSLLETSHMGLLRTLVQHDNTRDVIPTNCLRISVANRFLQYMRESLSEGQEAPDTSFIACVSPQRPPLEGVRELRGPSPNAAATSSQAAAPKTNKENKPENSDLEADQWNDENLNHTPHVPARIQALMAPEVTPGLTRFGAMRGFDAVHVWRQLHNLQILTYCSSRYLGMTVRLLYEEFLELYSVLCIPNSYDNDSASLLRNHPCPKTASAFLLQALTFPKTAYQLGRTMLFFRKAAFLVLEKGRIEYLERAVPAVTRIQRMWRTVRERAFVADMRSLCVRVQSHIRRIILLQRHRETLPLRNFFWGAVVLAGIAYAFRHMGVSNEVLNFIQLRYRNREVFCLRWSAAVCVQAWWRSVLAQKHAAKLRQAVLLDHCSLLVQNAWRMFKAQAVLLEKITEVIIPNRAATVLQRHFRGWRERRKFQELRGLAMAFLSIQRKGAKLYSMRVMLNYRPIIRRTTVMRDMISIQLDTSIVRIQSFFRMAIIRKQYMLLRKAAMICQAGAFTRLRRGDFLFAKQMVVKIQRWWRCMLLFRGLAVNVGPSPPIQMPKKADAVIRRREFVAFELLRPHLLRVQGTFRKERVRQESQYAYPIRLQTNCDCRSIYPRTWAQPLQDLLTQLSAATSQQKTSLMTDAAPQSASVMLQDIAIGGHHTLALLAVRKPDVGNFATRVQAAVKGGGWQDLVLVPCVYAWGWGDRGQLGSSQHADEQGMVCMGPLEFVDRILRDAVDRKTGHLVQQLVHEIDYTHSICAVVAGLDHSVALTNDGMVFAWGDNSEGQCGLGHRLLTVRRPTLLPTIRNNGIKLKSITAGPRQTGAVCADGKALMWGASLFVRLPTVIPDSHSYTPREVPIDSAQEALQICCSSGFNVLRTANTSGVYVWGRNDSGQLGQGTEDKKSRDWPTFVPLPATPAHPHIVSKVAVGMGFVVVALEKKSSFLYTWGAIPAMEATDVAVPAAESSKKAAPTPKKEAGLAGFLQFSRLKAPQQEKPKPKPQTTKRGTVKAVCKPTRVAHPLWADDLVVDIAGLGMEVLVLFESRVVHGYTSLEVKYTQKAAPPIDTDKERAPVHSFFFKTRSQQPKKQEEEKDDTLSREVERLRGEFTLEPGVYSLRHLKPLRMAIRSIHSTGNAVSLSFSWATALRPTRQVLEDICKARASPLSKQLTTATGAPVELPKKIVERTQKKQKEIQDSIFSLRASPFLSRENQSRRSALPSEETLVPDARLLEQMRSTYTGHSRYKKFSNDDTEFEGAIT